MMAFSFGLDVIFFFEREESNTYSILVSSIYLLNTKNLANFSLLIDSSIIIYTVYQIYQKKNHMIEKIGPQNELSDD